MHAGYPIASRYISILSWLKKEKQLNSSNPAAHDSVDVFLPYFLDPQFSSSSNTSTGSSLDGFELEAAAIELFAEI
jgi:hypothetical protein